jgi:galactokinase
MMDQFSALLGRRDHALFLDCRPSAQGVYAWEHVLLPDSVQVMLLNSGVRHENVRGEFNQRVAECKVGVKLLQQAYPHVVQLRDATPQALGMSTSQFWETVESMLPAQANADGLVHRGLDRQWLEELIADHGLEADATFAVRSRCRHVITENARVQEGVAALRQGRAAQFGRLMSLAHASMRDDYGASCPEADALVEIVSGRPGVLGARITGAGWGGGVVALVRRGAGQAWIDEVGTAYQAQTGLQCEIYLCRPGDRAGQVGELA